MKRAAAASVTMMVACMLAPGAIGVAGAESGGAPEPVMASSGATLRYMGLSSCRGGRLCGPWKAWLSDGRVIRIKDARATVWFPAVKKRFAAPMGVSPHGGHLAYTRRGDRALIIRSLVDGYVRQVPGFVVPDGDVKLTVSPLGRFVGVRDDSLESPLRIVNTATGAVSTLPKEWHITSFAPDATRILLRHAGGDARDQMAVYDTATSALVPRPGFGNALAGDGDTLATRTQDSDGRNWITFTSFSKGTEIRPRIPVPTHNVDLTWNQSGTLTIRIAILKGPWRNYRGYDRSAFDPRTGGSRALKRLVVPRGLRAARLAGFTG